METIASKKTRTNMENEDHFAQLLETAEVEYQKYLCLLYTSDAADE